MDPFQNFLHLSFDVPGQDLNDSFHSNGDGVLSSSYSAFSPNHGTYQGDGFETTFNNVKQWESAGATHSEKSTEETRETGGKEESEPTPAGANTKPNTSKQLKATDLDKFLWIEEDFDGSSKPIPTKPSSDSLKTSGGDGKAKRGKNEFDIGVFKVSGATIDQDTKSESAKKWATFYAREKEATRESKTRESNSSNMDKESDTGSRQEPNGKNRTTGKPIEESPNSDSRMSWFDTLEKAYQGRKKRREYEAANRETIAAEKRQAALEEARKKEQLEKELLERKERSKQGRYQDIIKSMLNDPTVVGRKREALMNAATNLMRGATTPLRIGSLTQSEITKSRGMLLSKGNWANRTLRHGEEFNFSEGVNPEYWEMFCKVETVREATRLQRLEEEVARQAPGMAEINARHNATRFYRIINTVMPSLEPQMVIDIVDTYYCTVPTEFHDSSVTGGTTSIYQGCNPNYVLPYFWYIDEERILINRLKFYTLLMGSDRDLDRANIIDICRVMVCRVKELRKRREFALDSCTNDGSFQKGNDYTDDSPAFIPMAEKYATLELVWVPLSVDRPPRYYYPTIKPCYGCSECKGRSVDNFHKNLYFKYSNGKSAQGEGSKVYQAAGYPTKGKGN